MSERSQRPKLVNPWRGVMHRSEQTLHKAAPFKVLLAKPCRRAAKPSMAVRFLLARLSRYSGRLGAPRSTHGTT